MLHRIRWGNVIVGLVLAVALVALLLGPPVPRAGTPSQTPARPASEATSMVPTPDPGLAGSQKAERPPAHPRRRSHARKQAKRPHTKQVARPPRPPAPVYAAPEPPPPGVADLEP